MVPWNSGQLFQYCSIASDTTSNHINLKNRFLWGPQVDQLLADEQYGSTAGGASSPASGPGNTLWALADHLGTIRDIADFDTAANPGIFSIVNHRVFDSFGNLTSQTSSSASASIAFRYTGKYFDSLTGLSHHWNRWYDPKLGKWISEDPIGFAGGDENTYRFVGNKVVDHFDSNGLKEVSVYHLTTPDSVGSIIESGMKPGKDGLIWVSDTPGKGLPNMTPKTVGIMFEIDIGGQNGRQNVPEGKMCHPHT
jgi:RHS repeat-associated protein